MSVKDEIPESLRRYLQQLSLPGTLESVTLIPYGHINKTFVSQWRETNKDTPTRYIHQVLNTYVFPNVQQNVRSLQAVVNHRRVKRPHGVHPELVTTNAGEYLWIDPSAGDHWRTFRFIEGTVTHTVCSDTSIAYEAGKLLGEFFVDTQDLPVADFPDVLPQYHETPTRLPKLQAAVTADVRGRVAEVRCELEIVERHRSLAPRLMAMVHAKQSPWRVTHNDPKISNFLFSQETSKGVALIDFDTIQGGSLLFDIGDFLQSACAPVPEDLAQAEQVVFNKELYHAARDGVLATAQEIMTTEEQQSFLLATAVIVFELGVRFLTDYLEGDVYFTARSEKQNFYRAQGRLRLVDQVLSHIP